jgi:hypothetical protein
MRQAAQQAAAEVLEVFAIGLADFAEEEAFEVREALAIVERHLGEEPKGFAAAACAAEADGGGTAGMVAEASGGAGSELLRLEKDPGVDEVFHLIARAASEAGSRGESVGP